MKWFSKSPPPEPEVAPPSRKREALQFNVFVRKTSVEIPVGTLFYRRYGYMASASPDNYEPNPYSLSWCHGPRENSIREEFSSQLKDSVGEAVHDVVQQILEKYKL